MKSMRPFLMLLISVSATAAVKVPISFMEALAPTDTTSSSRFQTEYDAAIQTAKTLLAEQLKKCGYELVEKTSFYEASDPLQAKEKALKEEVSGAWLIVGPRRSDHYLLTTQGAPNTPSVSLMANSSDVFALAKTHQTLGVSNKSIAQALIATATKHLKRKSFSYISITNQDCVFCLDLARSFKDSAKSQKLLREFNVVSETPNLDEVKTFLQNTKPDVILLPNYSKSSAYLMAQLKIIAPKAIFLGGDGWGTNTYGFVQSGVSLEDVIGFTARGSTPTEIAMKSFPLGQKLLNNPKEAAKFPGSNSALSILKIIESTADLLCKSKPKTKAEFLNAFTSNSKIYRPTWGVGVFKLEKGQINFTKAVQQ